MIVKTFFLSIYAMISRNKNKQLGECRKQKKIIFGNTQKIAFTRKVKK